MLYTIFWAIMWLMSGNTSFTIGSPEFLALVVALIADIFIGYQTRWWVRRP